LEANRFFACLGFSQFFFERRQRAPLASKKKREEKKKNASAHFFILRSFFPLLRALCSSRVSRTLGEREREREGFVLHILSFLSARGLSKSACIKKEYKTRERFFLLPER